MKHSVLLGALFVGIPMAIGGSLDPGAPPAPTMKTLSQVEPRVPVEALPGTGSALHVISSPGSYYLTANLAGVAGKSAIEITSSDVVLDLAGFSIVGTAGAFDGVVVTGVHQNVSIQNGTLRGWPDSAINLDNVTACHVAGILIDQSGRPGHPAILGGYSCVIEHSSVLNSADVGILVHWGGVVSHCTARANNTGIFAQENSTVRDSNVFESAFQGIVIQNQGLILNNTIRGGGIGIDAGTSVIVKDNSVREAGTGIYTEARGSSIEGNQLESNSIGVHVSGAFIGRGVRVQDNQIVNGGTGILIDAGATRNFVVRNTAWNNTTNYSVAAGNTVGPIVNMTAGGTIASTNPWANFSY